MNAKTKDAPKPESIEIDSREDTRVQTDIRWLYSKLSIREPAYLLYYNRFMFNNRRRDGLRNVMTPPPSALPMAGDPDTGIIPAINVGRSIALTLRSKLIQTKGRLFLSPVNGLWKTIKTCRNAQIYFDAFVERDQITQKMSQVVLDAEIFEVGWLWVDEQTKSTRRVKPWEVFVDPAEANYGTFSRCMVMFDDYPIIDLKDKLKEGSEPWKWLQDDVHAKSKVYHYWDLIKQRRYLYVGRTCVEVTKIKYSCLPLVPYYHEKPIKGLYSTGVMANVYQNQRQIDSILYRIHDALELTPANTIYIPKSATEGSVPSKMLSNKVGNTVEYLAALGKPEVVTPAPIDASWQQYLQFFIQSSYEQEGISMLSATSRKPSGDPSGKALDTLQDVESERFQEQVDNVIQCYKNVYNTMIEVFPEDDDILPERINRSNIKWSEIKRQRDSFNLTSSLSSVLSKEPVKRREELEGLVQMGVLNPNMIAQLMQLPDLEGAYSSATASYDNCLKIIERAIEDDRYDFLSVVNLKQLLEEVVNIMLQLDSVDEKPEVMRRLAALLEVVKTKMNATSQIAADAAGPAPEPPKPMQDMALNGAQIQAAADVAFRIGAGQITPNAGRALLMAGFPNTPPEVLDQIVGLPSVPAGDVPPGPENTEVEPPLITA